MPLQVDLRILELLSSRLCHDLVGPIGAVNNGVELLEDFDQEMMADVVPLIRDSARQAWRRLDFFRVAFGFGGGRDGWPVADLQRFAGGLLEGGKVVLNWAGGAGGPPLEARAAKLLLNLILLGSEALPRGGELGVAAAAVPSGWRLAVTATGTTAQLHERVQETLLGRVTEDEVEARTAQAFFTTLLARDLGGAVRIERPAGQLILSFLPGN